MTDALLENDSVLSLAHEQVAATLSGTLPRPVEQDFFDDPTNTATFVVHDLRSLAAAVIDSVLDVDPAAGTLSYEAADRVVAYVRAHGLAVAWILETHVHTDHLSAAPYLQERLGGRHPPVPVPRRQGARSRRIRPRDDGRRATGRERPRP